MFSICVRNDTNNVKHFQNKNVWRVKRRPLQSLMSAVKDRNISASLLQQNLSFSWFMLTVHGMDSTHGLQTATTLTRYCVWESQVSLLCVHNLEDPNEGAFELLGKLWLPVVVTSHLPHALHFMYAYIKYTNTHNTWLVCSLRGLIDHISTFPFVGRMCSTWNKAAM